MSLSVSSVLAVVASILLAAMSLSSSLHLPGRKMFGITGDNCSGLVPFLLRN